MQIRVHHFAAAADVSGCSHEVVDVVDSATLADLAGMLVRRHGPRMADVLRVAAFLQCDSLTRDLSVPAAVEVDILPPFAGG